jgi:Secretion system C-terminal sorting domain
MKNLFNDTFEQKLIKYSFATGAALALINGTAEANVVISTAAGNTTVNSGNPDYNIDFNGDAKNDIKISYRNGFGGQLLVAKATYGSTVAFLGNANGNYFYPYALNQSQSVPVTPGAGVWGVNNAAGSNGSLNIGNYGGDHWNSVTDKYLGVRFKISGITHYGWVKMTSSGASSITISEYAYETVANTGIGSPLPVELNSFSAIVKKNKISLEWQTATEVNNYGFEIQRTLLNPPFTTGGTQGGLPAGQAGWEKIGFVQGAGNSNSPKDYSFVDRSPINGKAEYRLKQIDNDGSFKYSSIVTVNSLPVKFELFQNYPNPFNPATTIRYSIPKAEHITLKVYDELGNEVSTLVDENKEAGNYDIAFNGTGLASGIYYYRITAIPLGRQTGEFNEVKKLMLLK